MGRSRIGRCRFRLTRTLTTCRCPPSVRNGVNDTTNGLSAPVTREATESPSGLQRLCAGVGRFGVWRTVRGALSLAGLHLRRPTRSRVVLRANHLDIEFAFPSQCPRSLVMYRTLVEPEYALVDRLAPDDAVFLDVGSGIGTYSLIAGRRRGAQVHLFEPVAENVATIHRNLAVNGIHDAQVNPVVVSDRCGSADLERGENLYVTRVARVYGSATRGEVPAITLDQYLADHAIDHVDFLKVDVEGHEGAVLAGAERALREQTIGILVLEAGSSYERCRELLAASGYLLCFYRERQHALVEMTDAEHQQVLACRPSEFHCNVVAVSERRAAELAQDSLTILRDAARVTT